MRSVGQVSIVAETTCSGSPPPDTQILEEYNQPATLCKRANALLDPLDGVLLPPGAEATPRGAQAVGLLPQNRANFLCIRDILGIIGHPFYIFCGASWVNEGHLLGCTWVVSRCLRRFPALWREHALC